MHPGSATKGSGHQSVTSSEAVAENSPVLGALCHNEYLTRPQHAWWVAEMLPTLGLLESLHQGRGDVQRSLQSQAIFCSLGPSCTSQTFVHSFEYLTY